MSFLVLFLFNTTKLNLKALMGHASSVKTTGLNNLNHSSQDFLMSDSGFQCPFTQRTQFFMCISLL